MEHFEKAHNNIIAGISELGDKIAKKTRDLENTPYYDYLTKESTETEIYMLEQERDKMIKVLMTFNDMVID